MKTKEIVAIFGANGFLGRRLTKYLKNKRYEVVSISRSGNVDYNLDITKKTSFQGLDIDPDIVINCASALPGGDFWDEEYSRQVFEVNFWGSYNLVKWIQTRPSVKQVINMSTLVVIDKPWPLLLNEDEVTYPFSSHQAYCISKLNQELVFNTLLLNREISVCNARLSALFGEEMSWNGVLCNFIDKALLNDKIELKNGTQVSSDFLYVETACQMIGSLIRNNVSGVINLAAGEEVYLDKLAYKIFDIVKGDKTKITNVTLDKSQINRGVIDIKKIQSFMAGEKIVGFEEGLLKTVNYRKLKI